MGTITRIKRLLIGEPFPTSAESHERLDKARALAVFASDPISSNAYATEAIMSVLILMGSAALSLTLPVAGGIVLLVMIVIFSYIQTILHYPNGGGAYIVSKDNLGTLPSLIAAAALLTDYILTVSVSVSAGTRALTSAVPELFAYRVPLSLAFIALLTWINLRGVRESGTVFALPTYFFAGGVLLVILIGIARYFGLFGLPLLESHPEVIAPSLDAPAMSLLFLWLVARAFAAGCTALTGIEAISNGVQAFKKPEAQNAATTMVVMGILAMTLFSGITFLATNMQLVPTEEESILSQMTRAVVGETGLGQGLYIWVQVFTMLILVLAANTGYQDFPRLSAFIARDGFLPRWMQNRGDRLVFSGGIVTLALVSALVVVVFQADEIAMLPLYALGVMLSFTLSQSGMVVLMTRISKLKPGETLDTGATEVHFEGGWWWKRIVNGFGALVTATVLVILVATKFVEGAWIIVLAIPLLILMFLSIHRHYQEVAKALRIESDQVVRDLPPVADVVIVPVADIHRGTLRALQYARRMSTNVRAVCVVTNEEMRAQVMRHWARVPSITEGIELVCIDYDFRDILKRLISYIEHVHLVEYPNQLTTVVIPEFVPTSFGGGLLHNQTANMLRVRLRSSPDIVVIDVPYHINA